MKVGPQILGVATKTRAEILPQNGSTKQETELDAGGKTQRRENSKLGKQMRAAELKHESKPTAQIGGDSRSGEE
jgi:hypothetical protein